LEPYAEILRKFKHLKLVILVVGATGFVSLMLLALSVVFDQIALSYVGIVLAGNSLMGFVPLGIHCGVEQTYPVEEGNSSQMIFLFAQIWGFIISQITSIHAVSRYGFFVMAAIIGCLTIGFVFTPIHLKKSKAVHRASEIWHHSSSIKLD